MCSYLFRLNRSVPALRTHAICTQHCSHVGKRFDRKIAAREAMRRPLQFVSVGENSDNARPPTNTRFEKMLRVQRCYGVAACVLAQPQAGSSVVSVF